METKFNNLIDRVEYYELESRNFYEKGVAREQSLMRFRLLHEDYSAIPLSLVKGSDCFICIFIPI